MKTRQHEDDGNMKSTGSQQQIGEHQFAAFEVMQKKMLPLNVQKSRLSRVAFAVAIGERRRRKSDFRAHPTNPSRKIIVY